VNTRRNGIGMTSQRTRLRMIERLREQGIKDEAVLAAMFEVPRHLFVDEALASRAYDDVSLPINYNQTISQPYIVARMIEVLRAASSGHQIKRVLEIGTGCGYQAAVLAQVFPEVHTMERIQPLYERAKKQLRDLKIRNVTVRYADGSVGLPEAGPFDGIIMACAAPRCRRRCGSSWRWVVEWLCRSGCRNSGCIWSSAMRRGFANPGWNR